MKFIVSKSDLKGEATIPGSKSNTTRAVVIASLADGTSIIENPVPSIDCLSTVEVCRGLGAEIEVEKNRWIVRGTCGELTTPRDVLNVGNSGTTLYIITATSALLKRGAAVVTGDYQIRRRPSGPLIEAINALGGYAFSTKEDGAAPIFVRGTLLGGKARLPGVNSQWLTPLLINCPLAEKDTEVIVDDLQERPYIDMTMGWLERRGIRFEHDGYERFYIYGGQRYHAFEERIPSDWESACFPLVAAAITNSEITIYGLDTRDYQGDKVIIENLKRMGADVDVRNHGLDGIAVRGGKELQGIEIDCKDISDAPPILAVLGCCARGRTVLRNLSASRLKETDRPSSIMHELRKMGARIIDEGDRMIIEQSQLYGTFVDGHHDHRIVMATAVAALVARGVTVIDHAEYCAVSFPNFYEVMASLGATIHKVEEVS